MLHAKYFDDALSLHDETKATRYVQQMLNFRMQDKNQKPLDLDIYKSEHLDEDINKNDSRAQLKKEWASIKRIVFFQPLAKIRNYFGEAVAFYFAWMGTLIMTLYVPSLIGVIFFIVGLVDSLRNAETTVQTER
jgi:hypothetical protein